MYIVYIYISTLMPLCCAFFAATRNHSRILQFAITMVRINLNPPWNRDCKFVTLTSWLKPARNAVTKIVHSIFKHQPLFKAGKLVFFFLFLLTRFGDVVKTCLEHLEPSSFWTLRNKRSFCWFNFNRWWDHRKLYVIYDFWLVLWVWRLSRFEF